MSEPVQQYTVALGCDGRVATITIPTPWHSRDIQRVLHWISYMEQMLLAPEKKAPEDKEKERKKKPRKVKPRRVVVVEAQKENPVQADADESEFDVRASPGAIRAQLADGPLGVHALSKRLGFGTTSNSVRRALERMIEHGDIDERGTGARGVTLYSLAEGFEQ